MKVAGVYTIIHSASGTQYVGSSNDVRGRWDRHRSDLRKGRHHSPYLQRAWDKHGESDFAFVLLEQVEEINDKSLRGAEQRWIDKLTPAYNCLPTAGSSLGIKRSEATCRKIGEASRGRKKSPEAIEKQRQAVLGQKRTDESRARIREAALVREAKKRQQKES